MAKISLNRKEFAFLHNLILDRFLHETGKNQPKGVRQTYGFLLEEDSASSDSLPSIKKSVEDFLIANSLRESNLKIETRYSLYENHLLMKDPNVSDVKIGVDLLLAFLQYLGFRSISEFKEAVERESPAVKYMAFYYTRDFYVDIFDISIDYGTKPYRAAMQGFHRDARRPSFDGPADRKGFNMYLTLTCKERGGEEFHILSNVGTITDPSELKIMPATFMGTSTQGIPTCGECLLVKKSEDNEFASEEGVRRLTAYFMLKRPRVTAKGSEIRSLDDLTTKGISAKDLDSIAGNYAVWGFDHDGKWYQSVLSISPKTYECWYETLIFKYNQPDLLKQRCDLTISTISSKKLCITARKNSFKGREIVSFVMVDFGFLSVVNHVSDAVFITMSRHTGRSVAGHIMMMRTAKEIEPKELTQKEVEVLKREYPEIRKLEQRYKKKIVGGG